MYLKVEYCDGDEFNTFSYAKSFYELCESGGVDAETVAKMMLLEVENKKNGRADSGYDR